MQIPISGVHFSSRANGSKSARLAYFSPFYATFRGELVFLIRPTPEKQWNPRQSQEANGI